MEGGRGKNVDLPKAWSDLSTLAQCRGKIQEGKLFSLSILDPLAFVGIYNF